MLNICQENRLEIEKEFLALIVNKNEVLDSMQILPKYLKNIDNQKMLTYFLESWKENKIILPAKIQEKHKDFNIQYFVELFDETFYYESAWKLQLKLSEESIVKFYKEDILNNLNDKLKVKEIDYTNYIKQIKTLEEIKVNFSGNANMLTIDDIDMTIEENKTFIKSNTVSLDKAIRGFMLGQLSVWSGGNASAKSTYLNQVALESINQGYNVVIYSGELVAKRLLNWLLSQCVGKHNMSYNQADDYWFVNSFAKQDSLKWLNNKLFIYNNNQGNKAKEIINSIIDCIEKNNIKVVIIDNLMAMNLNSYGDNKYDVQSQFIQDLSALAKKYSIHIHFVCHPRKSTSFLRKVDISGSADLTNIADNVFIMHRVNQDFRIKTKELYKWSDSNEIYQYTNVIEVCKNREKGIEDYFVGMFFENESRRLLDYKGEVRKYKWETNK